MRISSTDVIEGGRVLYAIGKIKAATLGTPRMAPHSKTIGVNSF